MNVNVMDGVTRVPEARYAYYRRCQVFRKGGEQCKAPAEKGALICHAHAGQLATAVRREIGRRIVLAEALAEMRRKGRPEFEMADLFMDFNGIQVTIAVMARALIAGRIDCKTAGRLAVQLQMASKVLWMVHRKEHKGSKISPQISADERRLSKQKYSTTKDIRSTPLLQAHGRPGQTREHKVAVQERSGKNWAGEHAETRINFMPKMVAFADIRGRPHGPPGWARAA
ncbi:MAG TPA: hypothetical protein VGK36_12055 [Candidatus Angelobacter sp.]